ncbi:MAG: MliC family protein [Casimicrobiaceae bacterium]
MGIRTGLRAAIALTLTALPFLAAAQATPSFDCAQKLVSSVEQRICKDAKLAALDREMADAYAGATAKAAGADGEGLKTAQQTFIKTRNDCWKTAEVQGCVETAYHRRIAELQARYALVKPVGSGRYRCPGPPVQEAAADFYATDPPTAMVQFAGATQLMFVAPSGSGARYTGNNRQFWEHQDVAVINWGASTRELRCPKQ